MTTKIRYCEDCEEDTKQRYVGESPVSDGWSCIDCRVKEEMAIFGITDNGGNAER